MPVVRPSPDKPAKREKKRGAAAKPEPEVEIDARASQVAALEQLNGPDDGTLTPLTAAVVIVGRDPAAVSSAAEGLNDLTTEPPQRIAIPSDPKVSRAHLLLRQRDGQWWARDLGSTNGTSLAATDNPLSKEEQPLAFGVALRIGDTRVRVVLKPADSPEAKASSAAAQAKAEPSA
jgi:pSer/pThr/pTyr-binding forkhead associated (FHA) protein